MGVDNPAPIISPSQLQSGAFADLTRSFSNEALNNICIQASRACETETDCRFMPFTTTETHRAEGVDPDEIGVGAGIPLDLNASLGRSYAQALGGGSSLVRKVWLHHHAVRYAEMWNYSNVTVTVTVSIGGTNPTQILGGPYPDTGLVWFNIGNFIPIGSLISITYSGGYSTYPADLVRAAAFMAAAICCDELDPNSGHGHNSGDLTDKATAWLSPYVKD